MLFFKLLIQLDNIYDFYVYIFQVTTKDVEWKQNSNTNTYTHTHIQATKNRQTAKDGQTHKNRLAVAKTKRTDQNISQCP